MAWLTSVESPKPGFQLVSVPVCLWGRNCWVSSASSCTLHLKCVIPFENLREMPCLCWLTRVHGQVWVWSCRLVEDVSFLLKYPWRTLNHMQAYLLLSQSDCIFLLYSSTGSVPEHGYSDCTYNCTSYYEDNIYFKVLHQCCDSHDFCNDLSAPLDDFLASVNKIYTSVPYLHFHFTLGKGLYNFLLERELHFFCVVPDSVATKLTSPSSSFFPSQHEPGWLNIFITWKECEH